MSHAHPTGKALSRYLFDWNSEATRHNVSQHYFIQTKRRKKRYLRIAHAMTTETTTQQHAIHAHVPNNTDRVIYRHNIQSRVHCRPCPLCCKLCGAFASNTFLLFSFFLSVVWTSRNLPLSVIWVHTTV